MNLGIFSRIGMGFVVVALAMPVQLFSQTGGAPTPQPLFDTQVPPVQESGAVKKVRKLPPKAEKSRVSPAKKVRLKRPLESPITPLPAPLANDSK